jgi:hypothetical protein
MSTCVARCGRRSGVKVAKNRLAKLALEGTTLLISDLFKGPTIVAYSDGSDRGAEGRVDFAKTERQVRILGGAMGKTGSTPTRQGARGRCRRSTNCAAKLIGISRRRRPDRASRRPAGQQVAACSTPMPRRTRPPEATQPSKLVRT